MNSFLDTLSQLPRSQAILDKVRHFTSVEFNKDFIYRFLSPPQAFENQDDDEGVLGLSLSDN